MRGPQARKEDRLCYLRLWAHSYNHGHLEDRYGFRSDRETVSPGSRASWDTTMNDQIGMDKADQRKVARPPRSTGPVTKEQLIAEMHETIDKLLKDGASRGDIKILHRTLKELRYAFKVFAPYRRKRKVSIFGSARCPADCGPYKQAVEFGRRMAEHGWMVITGASTGIMEAGHVGAGREASIGVNILLPFEQTANYIIAGDHKLIHLKYFFTRKLLFVKESHAVALFPGGFGTLDEAFEVLTLVQTGKRDLIPLVFVDEPGGDYWREWERYIRRCLLDRGYISPDDVHLFLITQDVDEAVNEILGFYRVYHSMRYVGEKLVLRLQRPLSPEILEQLNEDYRDILVSGKIEQCGPLAEEADDPHLSHLTRLVLHFNRRDFGRLRLMINAINALGEGTEPQTPPSAEVDFDEQN